MVPAGLVGYLIRCDWLGTSILIPGILSGLVIAVIMAMAKLPNERLWPIIAPALILMHLVGAATASLLASVALPDMAARAELMPILEWTSPASLAIFGAVDILALLVLGRGARKR